MYSASAKDAVQQMQTEADNFRLRCARLSYAMADEFRARVIRNIDNNFGARAKSATRSEVARLSGRKLGASGNLRNSVTMIANGEYNFTVTVGNEQVPYAAIHEYGGTIVPRNARWLTIPVSFSSGGGLDFFNEITSGHRAREFDLFRVNRMLYFRSSVKQARRRGEIGAPAYFLAKQAKMPARPYFKPALESLQKDKAFMDEQMKLAGFDTTQWRAEIV